MSKSIYKIIKHALEKAGFKEMAPKDASRHSRASNMAMRGASAFDIFSLKAFAGRELHTMREQTEIE